MCGERRWWPNKGLMGRLSSAVGTRSKLVAESAKRWSMKWWPPMPPATTAKVVDRLAHVTAKHGFVVDVRLWFILWWKPVRTNLECPRLPCKTVEAVNGAGRILTAAHEDVAISSTAVVGSEAHIGTQYCACFSKEVLEILPADSVWKVANKEVYAPV